MALGAFAVSAPLFGVLASEPQFWVARRATYLEFAALASAVTMVSVALALLGLLAAAIDDRVGNVVHVVLVTMLFGAAALPLADRVLPAEIQGVIVVIAAALLGAGLTIAYLNIHSVRWILTYLAGAHVVLVLWLLATARGLGDGSPAGVDWTADSDADIVMVVFDELSAPTLDDASGDLDAERFPNFARLAETSVQYTNAYTVSDLSVEAIPTLLTGRFPQDGLLGTTADYPVNLFTLLGETHKMNVQEGLTKLCPVDLCGSNTTTRAEIRTMLSDSALIYLHAVLPSSLSSELPSIGVAWEGFTTSPPQPVGEDASLGEFAQELATVSSGEDRVTEFGRFLDSLSEFDTPTLHYAHVELPHPPWEFFPDGRRYAFADWIGGLQPDGSWVDDELQSLQGYQRYDLQLQFTDALLGMLLRAVEDSGRAENTLLVVTSDHGVNFQPGEQRRAATIDTVGSLAPIPLFIRYPGQKGAQVDDRVALGIDIVPTIVDFMGRAEAPHLDGRSLLGDARLDPNLEITIGFATVSVADLQQKARSDAAWLWETRQRLFRSGWLYVGPDGFYGRRVSDFDVIEEDGAISLAWPGLHNRPMIDGYLATNVRASIDLDRTRDTGLYAVAINGTIWDVTSPTGDKLNFVVPLEAYADRDNHLEIFGVDESDGRATLVAYTGT